MYYFIQFYATESDITDIEIYLGAPIISDLRENANEIG